MRDGPFGTNPDTLDRAKTVLDALREADLEPQGIRFEARGPGEFETGFSVVYGRDKPSTDDVDENEVAAIRELLLSTWGRNPQAPVRDISLGEIVDSLTGSFDEETVRAAVEEAGYEDEVDL